MSHTVVISPAGRAVYEQPLRLPPEQQHFKDKDFFFPVQHPCEGNQQEVVAALTHTSIPTLPSPFLLLTLYITSSPHISLLHHLLLSFLMDKVLWLHSQTFGASDSVCVCACWLDCFYRQKGRMDEQSSPSQAKPCSHSVCVCYRVCYRVLYLLCRAPDMDFLILQGTMLLRVNWPHFSSSPLVWNRQQRSVSSYWSISTYKCRRQ